VLIAQSVNSLRDDKESREIIESYLEALEAVAKDPHYQVSIESREKLILSALLIANANSQQSHEKNAGRGAALNQVLTAMGPAGRKLAQAIESHTDTPDDIKLALENSKTNAAPPTRWQLHEWAETMYPQTALGVNGIHHIGEILGCGSYGVTVHAYKDSGAETAITFLRPHMYEQAHDEFMILDAAAKILIAKNPVFKPFNDMQKEAALASEKEVQMSIAAVQQMSAEKLYEGLVISVNDHVFKFNVANWVGHGEQYKETSIIPGYHFNDLDKSSELKHLKVAAAQAIIAAELFHLLRGGYIDNDRHGGQQKLVRISDTETVVGNFDFGGMSLLPQTNWQKELMGSLIGEVLWEMAKPFGASNFDSALLARVCEKYIAEYAKKHFEGYDNKKYLIGQEKAAHFVGRFKRGMLALGNYFSVLKSNPEQLKQLLGAILATGQVDPLIEKSMCDKLGMFKDKLLALKSEVTPLSITYRRQ
jgi:hypothetical protein